jgi:hypothetical protein
MKEKLLSLQGKYRELRRQRDGGQLSEEDYRNQVQAIAVEDETAAGCWWNVNPENGRWIFYDGKKWVERAPEGFTAKADVEPAPAAEPEGPPDLAPTTLLRPVKKSRKWLWATLIIVAVAVIAAGSVGIWMLLQPKGYSGGGGGGGGGTDPERELLYDFYRVYSQGDYNELNKFLEIKRPVPTGMTSVEVEKQRTTIANIEQLGEYIGQYIMDFRFVGAPKAGDIEELQDIFMETEINTNRSIIKDGWDVLLVYECNETLGSQDYTIMSYGSDGMDGPVPDERGVVRRTEEDLIWADGTWVQSPEGHQASGDSPRQPTWWDIDLPRLPEGFTYRIGEVKTEDKRCQAKMILTIDGKQFEQHVSMLNDFGAGWRVVSVGETVLMPEEAQQATPSPQTGGLPGGFGTATTPFGAESEVRRIGDEFFRAYRSADIPGIKQHLTGEMLRNFEEGLEQFENDEEQMSRFRELVSKTNFEIDRVEIEQGGTEAKLFFKMSSGMGSTTQYLKMRLESGAWKIYGSETVDTEPVEEEARPAPEEEPGEEPGE